MSKRNGNVNDFNFNNVKKAKIDQTLEDLWGDDLDIGDIDDCLTLATEMCQQDNVVCTQRNNVTILPSYSIFKQTSKQLFTSTQHQPTSILVNGSTKPLNESASTLGTSFKRAQSFDCAIKDNSLEVKLKRLEEQNEAKTGEVSILRAKLQEIKAHHDVEQSKMYKEWTEKLLIQTKQLKGAETELEFKNIEILNLTQKLKDVAKLNHSNVTHSPFFKQPNLDRSITTTDVPDAEKENKAEDFKIIVSDQAYPLKNVIQSNVFTTSFQEMCLMDLNQKVSSMNVLRKLGEFKLNASVLKLVQLNTYELDLVQNQLHISNLLLLSEQLLQNLHRFLEEIKTGTRINDTDTINLEEICSESSTLSKDEMGFNAKETIICISETLPHCSYLKQRLMLNSNCTYLALLLSIIKLITKLKLAANFNSFLESTIALLHKISQHFSFEKLNQSDIISDLTKELIFCSTSKSTFRCLLQFLNNATLHQNFLSGLCRNLPINELQLTSNDQTLCYTRNTCVLQFLYIVLEEFLKNDCLDNNASALKFMSNSIRCNASWLFYQEDKCPCFSKVLKLYIHITHKTLQLFDKLIDVDDRKLCEDVLKSCIDTLYTLNFNLDYLVSKYIATYSLYKFVTNSLLSMKDVLKLKDSKVEVLENLNKNEEVASVQESPFQNINLWKHLDLN